MKLLRIFSRAFRVPPAPAIALALVVVLGGAGSVGALAQTADVTRSGSGEAGEASAPAIPVRLTPSADPPPPWSVDGVSRSANGIEFSLTLNSPDLSYEHAPPLLFVAPADRPLRLERTDAREEAEAEAPPEPGRVVDVGVLRRWRIVRVDLSPALVHELAPVEGPGANGEPSESKAAGRRNARLRIAWDGGLEDAGAGEHARIEALRPGHGFGLLMRRLIANPDHLTAFAMAAPPTAPMAGSEGEELLDPSAPWLGGEDKTNDFNRWGKFTTSAEGLYRIDRTALGDLELPVGDQPYEEYLGTLRLFSRGEPVPLLRVGEAVYFYDDGERSAFDPDRTWFVTVSPDLPDPRLPALVASGESYGGAPERTPVERTARTDRDRDLRIQAGNFLSIEGMRWIDAELRPEGPVDAPVDLNGYEADRPARLRLSFYVEDPASRSIPADFRVKLSFPATAAEPVFADLSLSAASSETEIHAIDLPPGALVEGANTIRLERVAVADREGGDATGEASTGAGIREGAAADSAALFFDWLEIDYPAQLGPHAGRVDFRPLEAAEPSAGDFAWTPLAPADLADDETRDLIALAVGGESESPVVLPIELRDGRRGVVWPVGPGKRVQVYPAESAPGPQNLKAFTPPGIEAISSPADYLIVTHPEFADLLAPLVELQQARGLRVQVVDVHTLYDHFSQGELDPHAIRRFLAWRLGVKPDAAASGRAGAANEPKASETTAALPSPPMPAPTYVLLFGDASSDYYNVARNEVKNFVPSFTMEFHGERWASDHWFAAVAGDDDLADYLIGRISVANRDDARTVIEKTVAYAREAEPGPHRARLGFVADDGEFPPVVDELRTEYTPAAFVPERIFLDERMPLEDNWYLDRRLVEESRLKVSPVATARIIEAFRSGLAQLTFYGHGSPNIWMDERVWFGGDSTNSDNQHLADSGRLTFVVNMTCNSGAIDYPVPKWNICISEDMMRTPGGGSVAMYVPSGPSVTVTHRRMSIELRRAMFGDGVRSLGELVALTKARYTARSQPRELVWMYFLLGDPALDLQMAGPARRMTASPAVVQPGDRVRFEARDVEPTAGRFVYSLTDDRGHSTPLSEPADYEGGRIAFEVPFSARLFPGRQTLHLYAWDRGSGSEHGEDGGDSKRATEGVAGGVAGGVAEFLASARVDIAAPEVSLASIAPAVASDGEKDSPAIELAVQNLSPLPVRDGTIKVFRLRDGRPDGDPLTQSFRLAPEDSASVTVALPTSPAEGGPGTWQVRLYGGSEGAAAATPSDVREIALPPSKGFVGFAPDLSAWTEVGGGSIVQLRAHAMASKDRAGVYELGLSDASGEIIEARRVALSGLGRDEIFTLRGDAIERASGGLLRIGPTSKPATTDAPSPVGSTVGRREVSDPTAASPADDSATGNNATENATPGNEQSVNAASAETSEPIAQLPVAAIPRAAASLQVDTESMRIRPASPTEGETIFLSFVVENAGATPSPPFTAAVYGSPPSPGDPPLISAIGANRPEFEPLKPWERRRLTLRWDPVRNAGAHTGHVALAPAGRGAPSRFLATASVDYRVRTKADLSKGPLELDVRPAPEGDRKEIWLRGGVANAGETAAHNLIVAFYSDEERTPENLIGEALVEEVPPGESVFAEIRWEIDPARLSADNPDRPRPAHEIRLRGSQQRIVRLEDNSGDEDPFSTLP